MGAIGSALRVVTARTGLLGWCALLAMAGGADAQAQTRYICRQANGSTTVSDRPCPVGIVYYGPTEQRSVPSYVPKSGEAPDYLKYMGARCSSMHDALRTAPVRGLKSDVIGELQRNYQRECAVEEQEARGKLSADYTSQHNARRDEKVAGAQRAQQSQLAQQQCDESKRILHNKKKRTDLSEGEKADLQRFEDNYRARCG